MYSIMRIRAKDKIVDLKLWVCAIDIVNAVKDELRMRITGQTHSVSISRITIAMKNRLDSE